MDAGPAWRYKMVGLGKGCRIAAYATCVLIQILPLVVEQW